MKGLLDFLVRYHRFFLFVVLQLICLTLIVRYNSFHRVNFLNSSNVVTGRVYDEYRNVVDYFGLKRVNEMLADENASLRLELQALQHADLDQTVRLMASRELFTSIPAKVINNSVNKQYNYITLNKGSKHGVKPDMGIIGPDGVVGVVINVSKNYATALSVLNARWSVSAKLDGSNFFGPLRWDGSSPELAILDEIPYHVRVQNGQKITTSGYSSIFPEDIPIGEVFRVEYREGDTFQRIWVSLSSSFGSLNYVDIIENVTKYERIELEELMQDE